MNREEQSLETIRLWIHHKTGMYYPEQKKEFLYGRLQQLCRQTGVTGLEELNRHLQRQDSQDLLLDLACAVSTNHTYFFREEESLTYFKKKIIPTLPAQGKWRLWSAASSTGDEAYTLAIILAEELGLPEAKKRVSILGTDISRTVIVQAEQGCFKEEHLCKVEPGLRRQYFQQAGQRRWQICRPLAELCTFRRLNLTQTPWPFSKQFHVIFCRNVLYYFDRHYQRSLIEQLYDQTTPGGWLITSVTESLWGLETRWHPVVAGVYRKPSETGLM